MSTPNGKPITGERTWPEESRIIRKWIEDHPVLLTALAFFLPSSGLYHFVADGNVPLEIASSDAIAALPMLLTRVSFLVIMLCALFVLPALMMFEGAVREQDGRLRVLPRNLAVRRKKLLQWCVTLALPGLMIVAAVIADTAFGIRGSWLVSVAICVSMVVFTWITRRIRRGAPKAPIFSEFMGFALAACAVQMMAALVAMQLSLRYVDDSMNTGWVALLLAGAVIAVAVLQVTIVVVIQDTSQHAGFVRQGFIAALLLVAVAFTYPQTGAALTGIALRDSASGGHRCVTLQLAADAADFGMLINSKPTANGRTVGLNLLSNLGGLYLARIDGGKDKTVYRIPTDKVVGMAPCKK